VAGRVQTGFEERMEELKSEFIADDVIFQLRYIRSEEVNVLFGAADATVLPYREASQSGVMFMSFAQGVPVIAPKLGGFPDDVVEGEMGYVFETNDPVSLNQTIQKSIARFGCNNTTDRELIVRITSEKYRWEESASHLIKIYQG
jgi:glycosyltransferase involved in cell wall biosynthesis